jgi:hypothetical protein
MSWIPQVGAMDTKDVMQEFTARDCYGKEVTVDSLRQLRQLETESEREYHSRDPNDPHGPQLLVWRDYAQDRSNADKHSFAKHLDRSMDDQETPRIEADPRFARSVVSADDAAKVQDSDVIASAADALGDGS